MNPEKINDNIQQWIELSRKGQPLEADKFYYDHIFDSVIERFKEKYSQNRQGELLVSLLGFSPEPIILTAKALNPETHLIISNPVKEEIVQILDEYLEKDYKLVILEKDDFQTIYKTIKESLNDYPTRNMRIALRKKLRVCCQSHNDLGTRIFITSSNMR